METFSWSISTETLLPLILSFNSNEKSLFRSYQEVEKNNDRIYELELCISEEKSLKDYFDFQMQNTASFIEAIERNKKEIEYLVDELNSLSNKINLLEIRMNKSRLSAVKFLDAYKLEYEQAVELLSKIERYAFPEDIFFDEYTPIYCLSNEIWEWDKAKRTNIISQSSNEVTHQVMCTNCWGEEFYSSMNSRTDDTVYFDLICKYCGATTELATFGKDQRLIEKMSCRNKLKKCSEKDASEKHFFDAAKRVQELKHLKTVLSWAELKKFSGYGSWTTEDEILFQRVFGVSSLEYLYEEE